MLKHFWNPKIGIHWKLEKKQSRKGCYKRNLAHFLDPEFLEKNPRPPEILKSLKTIAMLNVSIKNTNYGWEWRTSMSRSRWGLHAKNENSNSSWEWRTSMSRSLWGLHAKNENSNSSCECWTSMSRSLWGLRAKNEKSNSGCERWTSMSRSLWVLHSKKPGLDPKTWK